MKPPPPLPIPAMGIPQISCKVAKTMALIERVRARQVMRLVVFSGRLRDEPISLATAGIRPVPRPIIELDRTALLRANGKVGSLMNRSAMGKAHPQRMTEVLARE